MKRHHEGPNEDNGKRPNQHVWTFEEVLAYQCSIEPKTCRKICHLFNEGASIPFISRYRREVTGNLGPDHLRDFSEQYEALKDVREKADKLTKKLIEQNVLTPSLESAILNAISLEELEVLSAPFKSSTAKQTLAARARTAGLEPVAMDILKTRGFFDVNRQVSSLIDAQVDNLSSFDKVIEGIVHVIADEVVHSKEGADLIKDFVSNGSILVESYEKKSLTRTTKATGPDKKSAKGSKTNERKAESTFQNYFDFSMPVKLIKPHQVLAINRGEKKKELTVKIVLPDFFASKFSINFVRKFQVDRLDPARGKIVRDAIQDGYKRLVAPLVTRRVRSNLTRIAEKASIDVFAENLRNLLLTPPCKGSTILGIDPGYKNGCKMAVIGLTGEVLETGVIYPTFRSNRETDMKDKETVVRLVTTHGVDLISLGNGHGCRDVEKWLTSILKFLPEHVKYTIVTEDGASIYSCSPEGLKENPGLEPAAIGALSIARRLQDPLSEFVKIGPKHIGVGMYQHDISELKLKKSLKEVLLECVSFVGVDVNSAPLHLLRHVSGISETLAKNIIEYRNKNGSFISRLQLKKVKGIGEKVFEQCAGFVKIEKDASKSSVGGKKKAIKDYAYSPFDSTLVHPESYDLALTIIQMEGFKIEQVGSPQLVGHFKHTAPAKFENKFDEETFERVPQIIEALQMDLSSDLRDEKSRPIFRRDILSIENLSPGLVVSGVVRNVTHFGAFVDIGVGVDGLIHVSKMRGQAILLGQKVEVKVIDVDRSRERIGLGLENIVLN